MFNKLDVYLRTLIKYHYIIRLAYVNILLNFQRDIRLEMRHPKQLQKHFLVISKFIFSKCKNFSDILQSGTLTHQYNFTSM